MRSAGKERGSAMTMRKWTRLLLAVVLPLAGCKGFWDAPATSGGGGGTGASGGVFYVLNQATTQIAAYSIVNGQLTAVSGSPYSLASIPYSIAIAPSGGFLYVGTAQGIYLYAIGSGGALTLANNASVISSDLATSMQVDSTGSWLLEAGPNLAELLAISINPSTGIPSSGIELNTILPAFTIQQIAISPDNTHVYVTMGTSGTQEVVFAAGNSVPFGTSVNIPVKKIGGAALSAAVDPQNRLLYIGETAATSGSNSGGLRVLDYNTLIELSGSPFASGGLAPYSILPMSSGNIVYIANRNVSGSSTGNITGFTIASSGTTYSLTPLSTTASTGTAPVDMAVESTGTYLLVVNSGGGPDLNAYTFDSTTIGKLDSALTSSTGTDPVQASAIAALPK